jgi:hypothetical protein
MPREIGVFISSNRYLPEMAETKSEGLVGLISLLDELSDPAERAEKVASFRKKPYPQRLRPLFQCDVLVQFLSSVWKIPSLRWKTSLFNPEFIKKHLQSLHGGVSHLISSFCRVSN